MKLEVLHVRDCPNVGMLLDRLRVVTDLPVVTHQIDTEDEATARRMAGSPTLLVDGVDPFAVAEPCDFGMSCRIYRDTNGQVTGAPSVRQLREVLGTTDPVEILNSWRTLAASLEPVERAVHQALLRHFAATGVAPEPGELGEITHDNGANAEAVLRRLHDRDAIRLAADGTIAVAYPFSVTPTRHRVRIGDHVEVYAMCAIDALGIAAMLGQDTVITSVDPTTSQPVIVTTSRDRTAWEPSDAVVILSANAGRGPSADCCCDAVNFFVNTATAESWIASHPQTRGQVLSQTEAEELGIRLFQPLLAT